MICSMCGQPMELGLPVMRNVQGGQPQQRLLCFPCLSSEAEKIMRPRQNACPYCKDPPTGEDRSGVREMLTCANGHKW